MSQRAGNSEIYVMNADSSGQIFLTKSSYMSARPSWSRKTNLITFTSTRDFSNTALPSYEIYIMNGDGTNPVRLTINSFNDDYPFIK